MVADWALCSKLVREVCGRAKRRAGMCGAGTDSTHSWCRPVGYIYAFGSIDKILCNESSKDGTKFRDKKAHGEQLVPVCRRLLSDVPAPLKDCNRRFVVR